jgi:hypothetical protein
MEIFHLYSWLIPQEVQESVQERVLFHASTVRARSDLEDACSAVYPLIVECWPRILPIAQFASDVDAAIVAPEERELVTIRIVKYVIGAAGGVDS